jgi:hypothetical protein
MSGQSGSPNRFRTPETLPASASLSLISAERDGHSADATSLPLGDSLPPFMLFVNLECSQRNLPMVSSAPSKRSKVAILLRKMSGQSGSPNRFRTPETLPASASLSLISAELDGHSAGATSLPPDNAQIHGRPPAEEEHAQGRWHDDLPNLAQLSNTPRTRVRKALVQNQRAH